MLVKGAMSIALAPLLYLLSAALLSLLPVNGKGDGGPAAVDIYIITNGYHSDFVVPVKNAYKDWGRTVLPEHTRAQDPNMDWLAFGWGDRGVYLETPTWADLKVSTALNAVSGLGRAVIHTEFYTAMTPGKRCVKLSLSAESYLQLTAYIEAAFSGNGTVRHIKNSHYGWHDAFYEAEGAFNLFHTCNTWVNIGLKRANQKTCVWTPFPLGLFRHAPPDKP